MQDPRAEDSRASHRRSTFVALGPQRREDSHRKLDGAVRSDLAQLVTDSRVREATEQRGAVLSYRVRRQRQMRTGLVPELFHPATAARVRDRLVDGAVPADAARIGQQGVGAIEQPELALLV